MTPNAHYTSIEKAILYLVDHYHAQPSLESVAAHVGMSKYHFQRLFSAWAGVSPKQFVAHLTVQSLKEQLLKTSSILEASDRVGLSSQSRGYDLMIKLEAMTPGEYKTQGRGLEISYGIAQSAFGEALLASTHRGLCAFEFLDDDLDSVLEHLRASWHHAQFRRDDDAAEQLCQRVFAPRPDGELSLLLKGTPFQTKVWEALLRIPSGRLASYSDLAAMMGLESSVRAVASAVAKNPLGYIIPCHRVIRSTGVIHNYRWRSERKSLLLGWELSQQTQP